MRAFLSVDPSSTCMGFAFGLLKEDQKIFVEGFGRIRPNPEKYTTSIERVNHMIDKLADVVVQVSQWAATNKCDSLVACIEVPSGKVNRNRHKGGGAGLSIYGFAVGNVYNFLRYNPRVGTITVKNETWTGSHSKEKRIAVAKLAHPEYDPKQDSGADIADAICLAAMIQLKGGFDKDVGKDEFE